MNANSVKVTCNDGTIAFIGNVEVNVQDLPIINAPCGLGGNIISIGVDDDGDGVLDPEEVSDTDTICPI